MASLPPVILDTHEDWFNLLMTVLHQQAEQNPFEEYREMAQKLIGQFMRYGRPFVDSYHAPVSYTHLDVYKRQGIYRADYDLWMAGQRQHLMDDR